MLLHNMFLEKRNKEHEAVLETVSAGWMGGQAACQTQPVQH